MLQDRLDAGLPRTYCNPALRWNAVLLPVILLMAALPIGVRLHGLDARALLVAGYLLASGSLAFEFLRLRVVADVDGLVVVNYFSTHQIPWAQVRSIGGPPLPGATGRIELVDGQRVNARALSVVGAARGAGYLMEACAELRAIRSARLGHGDAATARLDA